MADVGILRPVGRKRHSPLLSYSNIPVTLKGVFSALNLTIRTSTLSDTRPHQSWPPYLCLPTSTRRFPLQVKCLPACIACTLREGRAGAADVFRLAHFVVVMGGPGLNEAGAGGEESVCHCRQTAHYCTCKNETSFKVAYYGQSPALRHTPTQAPHPNHSPRRSHDGGRAATHAATEAPSNRRL